MGSCSGPGVTEEELFVKEFRKFLPQSIKYLGLKELTPISKETSYKIRDRL